MFLQTALLYPCALAALCLGTGLLVDRCCEGGVPAPLLAVVGAAALVGFSQLLTYAYPLAGATPYAMAAVAVAGPLASRARALALARSLVRRPGLALTSALAYALCLAPVLAAGRASFSSYMALSDSAVHMIGADYLIGHGQHYAHLDLASSYGLFVHNYYASGYPSGADMLLGASAALLGLPLIWAFQPFVAFMLALAVGPAWMLARGIGLRGAWAHAAALSATVPALVYAYELLGSIKEIASIPLVLALGALATVGRSWLGAGRTRAVPFGLLLAAGVSVLGLAFGAWGLVAAVVAGARLWTGERPGPRRALALAAAVVVPLAVAAWPTWSHLGDSLSVASNIAGTSNPGNLSTSLGAVHVLGVWLRSSYKLSPAGAAGALTYALAGLTALAGLGGAVQLVRLRAAALLGWLVLSVAAWGLITAAVTTWAQAKTLVLTSPAVMLAAWGGVALARSLPARRLALPAAGALALALASGVLASDALQYHGSDLAPTTRYEELASIGARFAAARGPVLVTDFDEYALYELRRLDPGGPDFVYPPPALAGASRGYGQPVDLQAVAPRSLDGFPLIVTRRDPSLARPPGAYRLVWQGVYYEVWRRVLSEVPVLAQRSLSGDAGEQCRAFARLAAVAPGGHGRLRVAPAPRLVDVSLARRHLPAGWGRERRGVSMNRPGRLSVSFELPSAGRWDLWIKGRVMARLDVSLDGRRVASRSGQVGGNSLVPNVAPAIELRLAAGRHRLTLRRVGAPLAPGDGGEAVLARVFLTAVADPQATRTVPVARRRELCGASYEWVELLGGRSVGART